jgi:hypothetical protein
MTLAVEAKALLAKQRAAETRRRKAEEKTLIDGYARWIIERTGIEPAFAEFLDVATTTVANIRGEGVMDTIKYRSMPVFRLEDVTVVFDNPDSCLRLLCVSKKEGAYLGPLISVTRALDLSQEEKRERLLQGLVRAMKDADELHPVEHLRAAKAVCPACRRPW